MDDQEKFVFFAGCALIGLVASNRYNGDFKVIAEKACLAAEDMLTTVRARTKEEPRNG